VSLIFTEFLKLEKVEASHISRHQNPFEEQYLSLHEIFINTH